VRKFLGVIPALCLWLVFAVPAFAAESDVTYVDAKPTSSAVQVNGETVSFGAYNIANNNYFKLRDLAYTLSGTEKQFNVVWDASANAITLTSGAAYTAVGGEMASGRTGIKSASLTSSKIFLDGKAVSFTAYNIENNNYIKLRDVSAALDFGVEWNAANQTVMIDTSTGYMPEYITIQREQYSTELTELTLYWGTDVELEQLKYMVNLTKLHLLLSEINDLTPLAELTELISLLLLGDQISDITPLSGLTNLTGLYLSSNKTSNLNLTPLAGLTNLTVLYLPINKIIDLTPLAGLTNLTQLNLFDNEINNLTPLAGLTNLTNLDLSDNKISDLTPLSGLKNLRMLFLVDNPITQQQVDALSRALPDCYIEWQEDEEEKNDDDTVPESDA
jgi:Leucine-rich repeat (LRR) protein